jgi:hypothetical protein
MIQSGSSGNVSGVGFEFGFMSFSNRFFIDEVTDDIVCMYVCIYIG